MSSRNLFNCFIRNIYLQSKYKNILIRGLTSETSGCKSTSSDQSKPSKKSTKFSKLIQELINIQIQHQINASLTYLSIGCYFGTIPKHQPGAHCYFMRLYTEQWDEAREFIDYQLYRGGLLILNAVVAPQIKDWKAITIGLELAMEIKQFLNEKMNEIVETAEKEKDFVTVDYVGSQLIPKQQRYINQMERLITRSKRLTEGSNIGEYIFDEELYNLYCNQNDVEHI